MVVKLNCNSLENIHSWFLYGQSLLHRLFHWKSFAVTDRSALIVKLFHLKQLTICSILRADQRTQQCFIYDEVFSGYVAIVVVGQWSGYRAVTHIHLSKKHHLLLY